MKFLKIILLFVIFLISANCLFSQVETWLQKGQSAIIKKKYDEAIKNYSKAIQLDSSRTDAYYNRGLAYLYLEKYPDAIEDFSNVIKRDSSKTDAYNNRGLAYGFIGKVNEAINDFNYAIKLDSSFSMAYFNRGNAFMSLNNDNAALNDFNKSIAKDSSNPAVYFQRGTIHYSKGNYDNALYDFTKAIRMGFKPPKIFYNLGNTYYKLNQFDKAIKNYNEVLKLDSNDFEALNNRAIAFDKSGQKEKAENDRKKLQRIRGDTGIRPPVESLKYKKFTAPDSSFSISLPDGWNVALSDSVDVIELNVSPEPIKTIRDPYFVGVHLSLNLNMYKHWGKTSPDEIMDFWKGSVSTNIKDYYGYKKYTEKYFSRFDCQGLMTNIQIQITEKSVPLVLYEYALAKDNVLFFAYFQAPVSDFAYYQNIFDKAIESLILN
ncbi:MAG: tetratricopeptide repeat protein [Bacteroidetes bacterium]|nr:MAG: tetratricopeptide repeat protein [Bacteroidota bacterium]